MADDEHAESQPRRHGYWMGQISGGWIGRLTDPRSPAGGSGPGYSVLPGALAYNEPIRLSCNGPWGIEENPYGALLDPLNLLHPQSPVARYSVASRPTRDEGRTALDPAIEILDLVGLAKAGAYSLKGQFPSIHFTSGRRSLKDQANAMAGNVVRKRDYIKGTYDHSRVHVACQKWVDEHPEAGKKEEIAAGLLGVIQSFPPAEAMHVSKHCAGLAFDVQPVVKNGAAIKAAMAKLPGKTKFFDREAGLEIWHVQF